MKWSEAEGCAHVLVVTHRDEHGARMRYNQFMPTPKTSSHRLAHLGVLGASLTSQTIPAPMDIAGTQKPSR